MKKIGLRKEDKLELEEKLKEVNMRIKQIMSISEDKLLKNRDEEYDWMTIAVRDIKNHSAKECRFHWKNLAHPAINRSPWTKVIYYSGRSRNHEPCCVLIILSTINMAYDKGINKMQYVSLI